MQKVDEIFLGKKTFFGFQMKVKVWNVWLAFASFRCGNIWAPKFFPRFFLSFIFPFSKTENSGGVFHFLFHWSARWCYCRRFMTSSKDTNSKTMMHSLISTRILDLFGPMKPEEGQKTESAKANFEPKAKCKCKEAGEKTRLDLVNKDITSLVSEPFFRKN